MKRRKTLRQFEDRSYKALQAKAAKYERKVATVLKDVLADARAEIARLYAKYQGATDGLTVADAMRYGRLRTMERELIDAIGKAADATVKSIDTMKVDLYGEAYSRYGWSVDQASGVRLRWYVLNKAIVSESLSNSRYKFAIQTYSRDARVRVMAALNKGLTMGYGYQDMARGVKDAINATYAQALRIMRTEGQTAMNAAHDVALVEAMEQGVKLRKVWSAVKDDRTRDTHREMDGKEIGEDGLFTLPSGEQTPYPAWEGLSAEERINCRCSAEADIEGYEPSIMRTREDGVIPYQSYNRWENNRRLWDS